MKPENYPDIIYIETSSKEDTNISYLFDYSVKEVLSKIKAPVVLDRVMEFPSVEEEEVGCLKCIIN